MFETNETPPKNLYSRRFLVTKLFPGALAAGAAATALPTLLAGCDSGSQTPVKPTEAATPVDPQALRPVEPTSRTEVPLHLGQEKQFILPSSIQWAPDTHTPLYKYGNETHMLVTGNQSSYLYRGQDFNTLYPQLAKDGSPEAVMTSLHETYDNGYDAISSVVQSTNPQLLLGFTHMEEHRTPQEWYNFRASIGLVTSTDGGITWKPHGQIIRGKHEAQPGERVSGAGQPCAIRVGDSIYLYYIDWNGQEADAIHLARAKLGGDGMPGPWEKYDQAVIKPPTATASYAALPSISYNEKLGKYLAVFEANDGFYICTSDDGLKWDDYREIASFPQTQADRKTSDVWYSYPTLLSPSTGEDTKTSDEGILVYSKGKWEETPHSMYYRNFTIK